MGLLGDRLHWQATYRIDGYDFADWDDLDQLGSLIEIQQGDHIMLADLLTSLDGILAAIQAINPCCGPETQITSEVEVGTGDVPDSLSDDYPTWPDFQQDYMCRIGNYLIDAFKTQVGDLSTAVSTGSITIGVVAAIVGVLTLGIGWVFIFSVSVMLVLLAGVLALGETSLDDLVDDLETYRSDLVCAFVNATSAADLKIRWDAAVGAIGLTSDATALTKALLQPSMASAIFNGEIDGEALALASYAGADCASCYDVYIWNSNTAADETYANPVTINSAVSGNWSSIGIQFWSGPARAGNKLEMTITSIAISKLLAQAIPYQGVDIYRFFDKDNNVLYSSDTPPTAPIDNVWYINFLADNLDHPWSVDFGFQLSP
jgi:hypothetical protein